MPIPSRGRRAYNRVSSDAEEVNTHDSPAAGATEETTRTPPGNNFEPLLDSQESDTTHTSIVDQDEEDDASLLKLVILDPAQQKFTVKIKPTATIATLKEEGAPIHKVLPVSQRLIYRGKLLQDEDTLPDVGIVEDGTILHLFPKPRVVVSRSSSAMNPTGIHAGNDDDEDDGDGPRGAHVTQIILDPDEAERRSSILVLGSEEVLEAQNNIKLFSFLLLIICSMELLALFTIFLGVPDEEENSFDGHNHTHPQHQNHTHDNDTFDDFVVPDNASEPMRAWRSTDYIDLTISVVGFYVATLGIKAATENTQRLARQYMVGTFVVGLCWNLFYYFMNVQAEKKADEKRVAENDDDFPPLPDSSFYVQAIFALMLPAIVWVLCCVRAWQFHQLLGEAEAEAEERIRNEISDLEQGGATIIATTTSGHNNRTEGVDELAGDHELTLQNESATIT